ncbi:MAG TPA: helix-turn-helix domain-containing protein, partial [Dongiaceae bacterium]|nr:helix-turn-helix domain-containing protein [Dongiaceae bacterium]
MPRPKTLPDLDVLKAAYALMHERGPEALSFANVGEACGLSASTLVQRFKTKDKLVQATLLHAWDRLDAKTAALSAKAAKTPTGAIKLLAGLSRSYGGIEAYANGLLVLREDVRDPTLRARGTAWKAALAKALDACFAATPRKPRDVGLLLATHWQGSLLWWS